MVEEILILDISINIKYQLFNKLTNIFGFKSSISL